MENANNHNFFIVLQIKNAVILTEKITVFRMNRNHRIQRFTPAWKGLQPFDSTAKLMKDTVGGCRV